MDLFWLVLIWAVIGLVGALRRPRQPSPSQPGAGRRREVREFREGTPPQRQGGPRTVAEPAEERRVDRQPRSREEHTRAAVGVVLDRSSLLQGIIMKEVLFRPRGLRPWRPGAYRQQ